MWVEMQSLRERERERESAWLCRVPNPMWVEMQPSTGDSTFDLPAEAAWREMRDENDRLFFYNDATSETTWTKPAQFGWIEHGEL